MTTTRTIVALAAVLGLLAGLSGCGDDPNSVAALKNEVGMLQWQAGTLRSENTRLAGELSEQRADERAMAWAYGCDYLLPLCPAATVARGRALLAERPEAVARAAGTWLAAVLALKAMLAALVAGALAGGVWSTLRLGSTLRLEWRADIARRAIDAANPERLERQRAAAEEALQDALRRCERAEQAASEAEDRAERAREEALTLEAERERCQALLDAVGKHFE